MKKRFLVSVQVHRRNEELWGGEERAFHKGGGDLGTLLGEGPVPLVPIMPDV